MDPDITEFSLTASERAGVQVFRNYYNSMKDYEVRLFRAGLESGAFDTENLEKVVSLIGKEDLRFLPIIMCGFGDDLLKSAFRAVLPPGVPGGVDEMLSGYGPLADLSKRIRLAFAFDVVSKDTMISLDRIRKVRNRISHHWDIQSFSDFHLQGPELFPLEELLVERGDIKGIEDLDASLTFRLRLVWLAGRLAYEAVAWPKAKAARIEPYDALYLNDGTTWLGEVSAVCMIETRRLLDEFLPKTAEG